MTPRLTDTTELAGALKFLGAVEVAPAAPCAHVAECRTPKDCAMVRRFAYFFEPEGRWHVCCRSSILSLAAVKEGEPGHWEAVSAIAMPAWWSPDHQIHFVREQPGNRNVVLTASLETGEEVTL